MTPDPDIDALAHAINRMGTTPIIVDLDVSSAVALVSVIQLASRHPAAASSDTIRSVVALARRLQDGMALVEPDIGRLLERGWHEVYDVPRGET